MNCKIVIGRDNTVYINFGLSPNYDHEIDRGYGLSMFLPNKLDKDDVERLRGFLKHESKSFYLIWNRWDGVSDDRWRELSNITMNKDEFRMMSTYCKRGVETTSGGFLTFKMNETFYEAFEEYLAYQDSF